MPRSVFSGLCITQISETDYQMFLKPLHVLHYDKIQELLEYTVLLSVTQQIKNLMQTN